MNQMEVAKWLKGITIAIAVMGVIFFFLVMPYMAYDIAAVYPEAAHLKWPGMVYGWCIGAVCYAILYRFWTVCVQIGQDNSFSAENARAFVKISRLAILMAFLWFAGILCLAVLHMLSPAFAIFMIVFVFLSIAGAILSAALSHLIYKAYMLKQESELTI